MLVLEAATITIEEIAIYVSKISLKQKKIIEKLSNINLKIKYF